jgi:hypothetical protein
MRQQGMFDPARLVFIDETSTNTAMVRLRGRAARGERLVDYAPNGAWKTITFVGGLRQRGMTAPFVIEGAMNGSMFLVYVRQCLVPTLPIELAFSKLKAHLRKAAEHTITRLLRRIGSLLQISARKKQELLSSRRLRSNLTGIRSSYITDVLKAR